MNYTVLLTIAYIFCIPTINLAMEETAPSNVETCTALIAQVYQNTDLLSCIQKKDTLFAEKNDLLVSVCEDKKNIQLFVEGMRLRLSTVSAEYAANYADDIWKVIILNSAPIYEWFIKRVQKFHPDPRRKISEEIDNICRELTQHSPTPIIDYMRMFKAVEIGVYTGNTVYFPKNISFNDLLPYHLQFKENLALLYVIIADAVNEQANPKTFLSFIALLKEQNITLASIDAKGSTLLHYAAHTLDDEVITFILKSLKKHTLTLDTIDIKKAYPSVIDTLRYGPEILYPDNSLAIADEDLYTYINRPNPQKKTALLIACSSHGSKWHTILKLIQYGASCTMQDKKGNTSLHYAVEQGDSNVVEYIKENSKSALTIKNSKGETPYDIGLKKKEFIESEKVKIDTQNTTMENDLQCQGRRNTLRYLKAMQQDYTLQLNNMLKIISYLKNT